MSEPLRSVNVTVNINETEETEMELKDIISLDTVLESLKRLYPAMSSVVLVVSL
jgi:hypothetical protein